MASVPDESLAALREAAARHAGLRLLVLHGSRARNDAHEGSDWDLGYLGDDGVDPEALRADLGQVLVTDDLDLVDLARASALLRFRAADQGTCVFEAAPGAHQAFVLEATIFWCDAEAVIRRAQAAVLRELSA